MKCGLNLAPSGCERWAITELKLACLSRSGHFASVGISYSSVEVSVSCLMFFDMLFLHQSSPNLRVQTWNDSRCSASSKQRPVSSLSSWRPGECGECSMTRCKREIGGTCFGRRWIWVEDSIVYRRQLIGPLSKGSRLYLQSWSILIVNS